MSSCKNKFSKTNKLLLLSQQVSLRLLKQPGPFRSQMPARQVEGDPAGTPEYPYRGSFCNISNQLSYQLIKPDQLRNIAPYVFNFYK
jgi:hypothetical protein